jgi:hypothetical protein
MVKAPGKYLSWVEPFSVQGSELKSPNWLLTKGKHVDRYKCYVSPNPPAKDWYGGQVGERR